MGPGVSIGENDEILQSCHSIHHKIFHHFYHLYNHQTIPVLSLMHFKMVLEYKYIPLNCAIIIIALVIFRHVGLR